MQVETHSRRLRENSLKAKLRSQQFVVGTFLEIPSPALVELLGLAGFDFVVVDREHGAIDLKDTEDLIRAGLSTDISVLVRVPTCEPAAISQPLDMGAAGIHVPQVETVEMAELAVNSSKHHPLGDRGLQVYVRSASYGARGAANYIATANDDSLIVVQVEGERGVSNLDTILAVEGIDVAFIGPYDLSQSLGFPGQLRHPCVERAMAEAIRKARDTGKYIGTYCDDADTAAKYRSIGVSYLTVSIDAYIFLSGARAIISRLKE
jgi:4-hydroxy-2-oxoheptanedioate aldolase